MQQTKKLPISLIIPVLNDAVFLKSLLDQVCRIDLFEEIIVVDGGSADESRDVAKSFAVLLVQSKTGRAIQMNEAARIGTGVYFLFLHADVKISPDFPATIKSLVADKITLANFCLEFDKKNPILDFSAYLTRFSTNIFQFGDQGLWLKADLFKEVGGFDENCLLLEDQEILTRLRKKHQLKKQKECLVVSARKYEKHGVLRLQMIYSWIYLRYRFGMSQEDLAKLYQSLLN